MRGRLLNSSLSSICIAIISSIKIFGCSSKRNIDYITKVVKLKFQEILEILENLRKSQEILENPRKSLKILENPRKPKVLRLRKTYKIRINSRESLKIQGNTRKSQKIVENSRKSQKMPGHKHTRMNSLHLSKIFEIILPRNNRGMFF